MKHDRERLIQLARLSALVKERQLSTLAKALSAWNSNELKLKQLRRMREARYLAVCEIAYLEPSTLTGVDSRWYEVLDVRENSLTELSVQRADAVKLAQDAARVAIGRSNAIERLAKRKIRT